MAEVRGRAESWTLESCDSDSSPTSLNGDLTRISDEVANYDACQVGAILEDLKELEQEQKDIDKELKVIFQKLGY